MQPLAARVNIKGSCAALEAQGFPKQPYDVDVDLMGLFLVEDESTLLVALGKVYNNSSTIHNVRYADDVVRVKVVQYHHSDVRSLILHQRFDSSISSLAHSSHGPDILLEKWCWYPISLHRILLNSLTRPMLWP
ncbi:hypothetical protein GmHk_09G025980 [Glycine max]|nr:hypothetical protein GmHk_09G025980 [Glycine max]